MERLSNLLKSIDGKGYKAYKDIAGFYNATDYNLEILNVQGDPFASPTMFEFSIKVRKVTDNLELLETKIKKTAFEDYLLRELYENLEKDGYIGEIFLLKPQDEIIKRTVISIKGEKLFIKYYLNLPAKGRNVLGNEAFEKIDKFSKKIYEYLLGFNVEKAKRQIKLFENIENLREKLKTEKVKVFIANGTIIKKEDKEIRIDSPPTLEREFVLENGFSIKGMCINEGITVITGYDFQGKSTLLEAIASGVYNHIEGSGKEFLLTDKEAVNIFAEKGRIINGLDMSSFIRGEERAKYYIEQCASSLISQTANVLEAVEVGKPLLLIDEDNSVTNFLYRDAKLKEYLQGKEHSIPFIEKMNNLYEDLGVSSIVVTSSIGAFMSCADQVLLMKDYEVLDITNSVNKSEWGDCLKESIKLTKRKLNISSNLEEFQNKKVKFKTSGMENISFGKEEINLNKNNLIIDNGQLNFIVELIKKIFSRSELHGKTLKEILDTYEERIDNEGIEEVLGVKNGSLIFARKYEVAAVINRFKKSLYV